MNREEGFLSILVIIIIVAISAVSGATLYYTKERPKQDLAQNQPQPTYSPVNSPSPHTSLQATKGAASQSPVPSVSPKVQIKTSDSSENLSQQFSAIEKEILEGKAKGLLFSPNHSDRILNDLANLESKSYSKKEIEKLRQTVIELSPHLKDQAMQSTSPVTSSVSPVPSQTPSCLKTNPTLVADITDLTKVQKITAPGTQSSEGPKGHSFVWTNSQKVPVYAPIAGVLESGAYSKDNESSPAQYILWFDIKGYCDFQFKFDHIDEPIETIKQNFPSTPKVADSRGSPVANRVEFKAGDLIGYTKGNIPSGNWDFGLYDKSKDGALAQYGSTGSHRNAVCWVDFYSSTKQQQYRSLLEGPKLVCSF